MTEELVLNLGADKARTPVFDQAMVQRTTDPVAPNASLPGDFAAQYPTPLDTTELLAMCEEVSVLRYIPEHRTGLKQETYREMDELAFTSGSAYLSFADYACPEPYEHDGDNVTITLKNIGAYKALGISDIMHSQAVASANWNGINNLVGPFPGGQGFPGGEDMGTFQRKAVADLKAKEMQLGSTLVLNGWDRLLVLGNAGSNALEFSGLETLISGSCAHAYTVPASGTFSAITFDRFLSEACAAPTVAMGHPQAIQEMMSAYFQLGYQGSQVVNHSNGSRLIPGYNFASAVNTGRGQLPVVADTNFTRTDAGGAFRSNIYPLRMTHNGEDLIYRITQIPLSFKDLAPGCTSIQFMLWAKTALVVKACCAQGVFTSMFTGRVISSCPRVGLTND